MITDTPTKRVHVAELAGKELSWAVALAEGNPYVWMIRHRHLTAWDDYTQDWKSSGPIIERERLHVIPTDDGWTSKIHFGGAFAQGSTPLVAALRVHVAATLGLMIDVPEDLI
jgi:Protein of unknown function (DUF2591)